MHEKLTFHSRQLAHHGVAHQGVQSEAELGLAVRILHLPHPTGCEESTVTALQDNILDVVIRLTGESKQQWQIEIVLVNCPFYSNSGKEDARHLFFEYEFVDPSCTSSESGQGGVGGGTTSIVKQILDDWRCMCMLYDKAFELQEYLKGLDGDLLCVKIHLLWYSKECCIISCISSSPRLLHQLHSL